MRGEEEEEEEEFKIIRLTLYFTGFRFVFFLFRFVSFPPSF